MRIIVGNIQSTIEYDTSKMEYVRCFKKLRSFMSVDVPGAYWIRKSSNGYDGKRYFLTEKSNFATGFLPSLLKWLEDMEIDVELVDRRNNYVEFRNPIDKALPNGWLLTGERAYQGDAVEKCCTNTLKIGGNEFYFPRGMVMAATNAGKATLLASIIQNAINANGLFVCRGDVTYREAVRFFSTMWHVSEINAKSMEFGRLTVAMQKTLFNRAQKDMKVRAQLGKFHILMADECFTGDVEILTSKGYKRFDALDGTEFVAQWDEHRVISFVQPTRVINKAYEGDMYKITWSYDHSVCCTPGHEFLYVKNGMEKIYTAEKLYRDGGCKFPVSGIGSGDDCLLTSYERLLIAVKAGGSEVYKSKDGYYVYRAMFMKKRKQDRYLSLLIEAGIEFKEIKYKKEGLRGWVFKSVDRITKLFEDDFSLQMGYGRARDFVDEVAQWGGKYRKREGHSKPIPVEFNSTIKSNVDFLCAVGQQVGYRGYCTEIRRKKEAHSLLYRVVLKNVSYLEYHFKKMVFQYSGKVYCVSVPSGRIVCRSKGFTFMPMNCHEAGGKEFSRLITWIDAYAKFFVSGTISEVANPVQRLVISGCSGAALVKISNEDMIAKKVSLRPIITIQLNEIRRSFGSYDEAYSECVTYSDSRAKLILDEVLKKPKDRTYISFNIREHGKHLYEYFCSNAPQLINRIDWTHGLDKQRHEKIEAFKRGDIDILICSLILKQSANIPDMRRLILTQGGKSKINVKQLIGRLIRDDGVNETVEVIDFFDDTKWLADHSVRRIGCYQKEGFEVNFNYATKNKFGRPSYDK